MAKKVGLISIDLVAGTAQFNADMDRAKAKLASIGSSAQTAGHQTVSGMQASSAAIRVFEGNMTNNLRAVENFISKTLGLGPALRNIFPVVGAIAFAGLMFELGEKAVSFFKKMSEGPARVADAFRELNAPIRISNEELQVTNDRLANEIAKLEGKPENALKLALDQAILASDQLGQSLAKNIASVGKLLTEHRVSMVEQIFGQSDTADIENEMKQFQRRVADVSVRNSIPRQESVGGVSILSPELLEKQKVAAQTRTNTELTALYTEEIRKLNHELQTAQGAPSGGSVDAARRIEMLSATIENLTNQRQSIEAKTTNANLEGEKASAEAAATALRLRTEAQRKALEAWEFQKRAYEEEQRAAASRQQALDRAAQSLYDLTQRLATANRELTDRFQAAAEKYAEERGKLEAESAKKLFEPKPEIAQIPIEVPLKTRLQGGWSAIPGFEFPAIQPPGRKQSPLAEGLDITGAGQKTIDMRNADLETEKQLLAAMQKGNYTLGQQLEVRKKILEAEIALGVEQGENVSAEVRALGELQRQVARMREQAEGWSTFFASMAAEAKTTAQIAQDAIRSSVDALSSNLANLATGGKTDFGKALQNIGRQMVESSIKSSLQRGLASLGLGTKRDGQSAASAVWVQVVGQPGAPGAGAAGAAGKLGPVFGGDQLGGVVNFFGKAFKLLGPLLGAFGGGGGGLTPSVTSSISYGGALAGGGDVSADKAYIVGDDGPEILRRTSGTVMNNRDSRKLLDSNSGHTYNIAIDARGTDPVLTEQRTYRAMVAAHHSAVGTAVKANIERTRRVPTGA